MKKARRISDFALAGNWTQDVCLQSPDKYLLNSLPMFAFQVVVQRLQTGAFASTSFEEERGRWNVVETRRSAEIEKGSSSIYSQIAGQVAELNVADLRLPARSWKVRERPKTFEYV